MGVNILWPSVPKCLSGSPNPFYFWPFMQKSLLNPDKIYTLVLLLSRKGILKFCVYQVIVIVIVIVILWYAKRFRAIPSYLKWYPRILSLPIHPYCVPLSLIHSKSVSLGWRRIKPMCCTWIPSPEAYLQKQDKLILRCSKRGLFDTVIVRLRLFRIVLECEFNLQSFSSKAGWKDLEVQHRGCS